MTTPDIQSLFAGMTAEQIKEATKQLELLGTEKEKEEKKFEKVLSSIKAMGEYDKEVFTQLLANNDYIILPEPEKPAPELVKMEFPPAMGKTRNRNFKVKLGEDPRRFTTAGQKELWKMARTEKARFLECLTADGKAYYGTEEGKAEIDSWFA